MPHFRSFGLVVGPRAGLGAAFLRTIERKVAEKKGEVVFRETDVGDAGFGPRERGGRPRIETPALLRARIAVGAEGQADRRPG